MNLPRMRDPKLQRRLEEAMRRLPSRCSHCPERARLVKKFRKLDRGFGTLKKGGAWPTKLS